MHKQHTYNRNGAKEQDAAPWKPRWLHKCWPVFL
jgi:hypothetical protein